MNDRLEGIVEAILESRILRRKMQSCIRYLLSCNLGLILFIAAATLSGLAYSGYNYPDAVAEPGDCGYSRPGTGH